MRVGAIASSDTFYDPDDGRHERWSSRGVLAVEMEAAVIFTIGALRKVQAGCLLTVSDIVVGGEFTRISDEDLQAAVDRMTRVALTTVTSERISETVFLVNPAADNGATGQALARDRAPRRRARPRGDAYLLRAAGPPRRARARGGRGGRDAPRRRRRRRNGERGRERDRRRRGRGAGRRPPRNRRRLRAHVRNPAQARGRARGRPRRASAREIDLGRATFRTWAGPRASSWFANIGERRNERRGRQARRTRRRRRSAARSPTRGARWPSSPAGGTREITSPSTARTRSRPDVRRRSSRTAATSAAG